MDVVFCGVDIGTANTKAVLLRPDGTLLDRVSIYRQRRVGGSCNSARVFYDDFSSVFQYFTSKNDIGSRKMVCSITSQGGSFVLLNSRFEPIGQVHSWLDHANDSVVQELADTFGSLWFYQVTGWRPAGWLMVCKLREMLNNDKMPKDVKYVATIPDFIFSQMTNKIVMDITNAQMTGICDFEKADWHPKLLNWTGIEPKLLPSIEKSAKILFDDIASPWGKISFVTGSHDQYAAMEAAGLEKDKSVMLGTGTAWVLNYRTSKPVFDNICLMSHPGRDLYENSYGNIITLGKIGRGCDELLKQLNVDLSQLAQIESKFQKDDIPHKQIKVDVLKGVVESEFEAERAIRRYMECAGSIVAFMLDKLKPTKSLEQIIMSGGATRSRFWPQIIADICNIRVRTIDFLEFTAYGASLQARSTVVGRKVQRFLLESNKSRLYEPSNTAKYQEWYVSEQKPMLEMSLTYEEPKNTIGKG